MWAGCRQYLLRLAAVRRSGKLPQVPLSGQARYGTDHPMKRKKSQQPANSPNQAAEQRKSRLAQALRDNLRRRKKQKPTGETAVDAATPGPAGTAATGTGE